ncbi:hypothetical protein CHS0354_021440 [Potamilus streckersoni]|uniref:C2H2-type domain-containing protein n=1 Tax=Potamilus streckersoni TaxID=2493646 RepID=A0AAE0S1R2_9BIVA|nr:hypothetical protein CHS0354_021440 [Potamilus streckersoni]
MTDMNIEHFNLSLPINFLRKAIDNAESSSKHQYKWLGYSAQCSNKGTYRVSTLKTHVNRKECEDEHLLVIAINAVLLEYSDNCYKTEFIKVESNDADIQEKCDNEVNCSSKKINIRKPDTEMGYIIKSKNISALNRVSNESNNNSIDATTMCHNVDNILPPSKTMVKSSLPSNDEHTDIEPQKVSQKRGRKKKLQTVPISAEIKAGLLQEAGGKRYSLRGVKLSREIMEAEKGIYGRYSDESKGNVKEIIVKAEIVPVQPDNESILQAKIETEVDIHDADYLPDQDENPEMDDDKDFVFEQQYKSRKSRRKKKLLKIEESRDLSMRKRQKIDLGDVPKFERRKRNNVRTAECDICHKRFCDYTGVDEHVRKFHKNNKSFESYLEALKDLKVVKCNICELPFQDRYLLQGHEDREHIKNVVMVCNQCGKKYKNLTSLRNHVRAVHILHGVKGHLCHLCPAKFKWSSTLKQHIEEIHEGKMHAECKICGKKFFRPAQLKRHERIHGLDESKRLFCTQCTKSFLFECNLQRHMQVVHEPQTEKFHCSYCGKGFHQKNSMIAHVQLLHFNLFPFTCKMCKGMFPRSKMLKDHMALAHKQTNYEVTDNPKERFKYNRTTEDLFYCSYCSSSFHYKAKLIDHVHTAHADAFPYKCISCTQGFLEGGFLMNHQKKAHGISEVDGVIEEKMERSGVPIEDQIIRVVDSKSNPDGRIICLQNSHNEGTQEATETVANNIGGQIVVTQKQPLDASGSGQVLTSDDVQYVTEIQDESEGGITLSESDTAAASLLVEVASGNNTYHYYIQASDSLEVNDGSTNVAQDIANLLIAAEQSIHQGNQGIELSTVTLEGSEPQIVEEESANFDMTSGHYQVIEMVTEDAKEVQVKEASTDSTEFERDSLDSVQI